MTVDIVFQCWSPHSPRPVCFLTSRNIQGWHFRFSLSYTSCDLWEGQRNFVQAESEARQVPTILIFWSLKFAAWGESALCTAHQEAKTKRPPWKALPDFSMAVSRNHTSHLWALWLCTAPSISCRVNGFLNLKEEPRFSYLCFYPWKIPSWTGKDESHNGEAQMLVVNSQRSQVGPVKACPFFSGSSR